MESMTETMLQDKTNMQATAPHSTQLMLTDLLLPCWPHFSHKLHDEHDADDAAQYKPEGHSTAQHPAYAY